MNRRKLGIIADDLTGACDTAAQLAYHNIGVIVTRWDRIDLANNAEAVALDTQSRHLTSEEASERVWRAERQLSDLGVTHVYKKIDSTLRGNWIVELQELISGFDFALIAPAFPRTGRTTLDGRQYVDKRLLERTAMANDVRSPARESHILNLLQRQTSLSSALVPLASVKRGAGEIANQMERLLHSGARLIVCDADEEIDLEQITWAGRQMNRTILWVGSAGLARYWPRVIGHWEVRQSPKVSPPRPMLIALGSLNPESRKQASLLKSKKNIWATEINLDSPKSQIQRAVRELASGRSVIIATPGEQHQSALQMRQAFAEAVYQMCCSTTIGTLVLIGGDTAERICEKLAVSGIRINGELDAGIPYGTIIGGILDGVMLVTKAGGFGAEDALLGL